MARIPDAVTRAAKERRVRVERLVGGLRDRPSRARGKDLIGRCPFHEDRDASLGGDAGKEPLALLCACQIGGGPIDWVMKVKGVSFRHAVELLARGRVERAGR